MTRNQYAIDGPMTLQFGYPRFDPNRPGGPKSSSGREVGRRSGRGHPRRTPKFSMKSGQIWSPPSVTIFGYDPPRPSVTDPPHPPKSRNHWIPPHSILSSVGLPSSVRVTRYPSVTISGVSSVVRGIPVESEIEISGIWGEIIEEIGKASTTISWNSAPNLL